MNTRIIIWGVVVILIGWGVFAFTNQKEGDDAMMAHDEMMVDDSSMEGGVMESADMMTDDPMMEGDAMMDEPMTM